MRGRSHALIILGLLGLSTVGAYLYLSSPDIARLPIDDVMGPRPKITPPRPEGFPTIRIGTIVGWAVGAAPVPAGGLKVAPFADKLDHPRWMLLLPNGDILVSESAGPVVPNHGLFDWVAAKLMARSNGGKPSADRITLLRDSDGDGVAETRSVLLTAANGLHSPSGIALDGDTLYVANTDALLSFPYKTGDMQIAAKGTKVIGLPAGEPNRHWARNVIVSPDATKLYVTVGSNSNIAEGGLDAEVHRANILEVDIKTHETRIYAAGLRNPNGLAYEPKSKQLWVTVNERDQLGADVPPDFMTQVDFGANYGWPNSYWGGYEDLRVEPRVRDQLQYFKRPDYALGPHTASLGIAFAPGTSLGATFGNGAFVAQHGSWNRVPASGYKVLFVPFGNNGFPLPDGKRIDVLAGFLNKDGDAQGRPVDVLFDKSGGLLVTDDVGDRIWRVSVAK
jgi:glucose/arabinose dehydrogenase